MAVDAGINGELSRARVATDREDCPSGTVIHDIGTVQKSTAFGMMEECKLHGSSCAIVVRVELAGEKKSRSASYKLPNEH
jgi:hypothetical protein